MVVQTTSLKTTFSFLHGKRSYGSIGKKKKKAGQRISIAIKKKIWEDMIFLRITKIAQTFMSHDWICNMLILHRLKEIVIQNKERINLGNDDLMHMKEET